MNAHDLNSILDGAEPAPAPAPVAASPYHSANSLVAVTDEQALVFARKFGALNADGTVTCIVCERAPGTLPSLCCGPCLWRRRGRR